MNPRFIVGEWRNALAIWDQSWPDPLPDRTEFLHEGEHGIVFWRSGEPFDKKCECCGHEEFGGFRFSEEVRSEVNDACTKLNAKDDAPGFPRFAKLIEDSASTKLPAGTILRVVEWPVSEAIYKENSGMLLVFLTDRGQLAYTRKMDDQWNFGGYLMKTTGLDPCRFDGSPLLASTLISEDRGGKHP